MVSTKVLVVEDESIVAQDVATSLGRMGYEVCGTVGSGEEALDEVAGKKPDLVLMDIVLAGELNGIQTAERIRRRFQTPVIYMTAYTDDKTLAEAGATDPLGYIVKPFSDRELRSILELAVFKARLETQRRRAEQALRESEHFARAIIASVGEGIIVLDRNLRYRVWNDFIEDLTGIGGEDMLGKSALETFPIAPSEDIRRFLEQALSGVTVSSPDTPYSVAKSGKSGWTVTLYSPHLNASGETIGVVACVRDVTQRRTAEILIRESEERFRQLAENIEDVFWIVSPDWNKALYVSPAYERTWGRPCQSLYDDPRSWLDNIVEEDRNLVIDDLKLKSSGDFANPKFPECRIRRPDGSIRWISVRAFPIADRDGNLERVAGIAEDITDRKRAEEEIQTLARFPGENSNPVLRIRKDGVLVYANRAGLPLVNSWQCHVGGEVPERWRSLVADTFVSAQRREIEFPCEDRVYSLTFAPIAEAGYVNVYGLDISARKRAEDALQRSGNELALRNRISDIFLTAGDDEIYTGVLQVVLDAVQSEFGFFGYINEEGALVCPSMTREIWERCNVPDKKFVFDREEWGGMWGQALIEKQTFCSNEPLHAPEGHVHMDRAMAVPLLHHDVAVGLISVANKETDYDDWDRHLIEMAAAHIAPILQAKLQSDIQYRARLQAEDALRRLRRRLQTGKRFGGIVGNDPKMLELFETIREVARVGAPVLVQGESGTGKELVASAIHNESSRADNPFIPVNCGALPENLLESELFGHVKGAFTGAIRAKKGRFELADGGTIFLDEVAELTPAIQVKLLRALQEGAFERVGGETTITVDLRLISATNKNLAQEVASGRFREDLYYRLCVLPLNVPPLRERRSDIPLLAAHILDQIAEGEAGKRLGMSEDALNILVAQEWPGNVRQLQNAIHFAATKCKGEVIKPEHLPPAVLKSVPLPRPPVRKTRKRKLDHDSVMRALEETDGNKKKAAKVLGVSRATLYRFLDLLQAQNAERTS